MPHNESDQLTPVEQLLRLKRYEKPADDFVDSFVLQFQDRQRSEMLRQSARGLLWERTTTYWDNMVTPKWAVGMAGAAAALAMAWLMNPAPTVPQGQGLSVRNLEGGIYSTLGQSNGFYTDAVMIKYSEDEKPSQDQGIYLSRHFAGGFADEARSAMNESVLPGGSMMPTSSSDY